jgi:hypothetical protein
MTTPTPIADAFEAVWRSGASNCKEETFKLIRKLERDLAAAQEWREAVLNELIVAHIYTKEHDTNPRKAIQDAIIWNCQVALDPAVSSDARKLVAQERERCAKVCDAYSEELRPYAEREYSRDDAIARDCAAAIRRGE